MISGWRYHPNQQELRDLFWATFYRILGNVSKEQKERIKLARLVGLFLDNGFDSDSDGNKFPAGEGHNTLEYLEVVGRK